MIKSAIKKRLISYLNSRSTSQFRQHTKKPDVEGVAYRQLKNVELLFRQDADMVDAFWRDLQSDALKELLQGNGLSNFLRLPTIQKTMYESYTPFLIKEYLWVNKRVELGSDLLREDNVGNPVPFLLNSSTSGNLIHHLYHILKFDEFAGDRIRDLDEIVEFGGGYGSICRLFFRVGFKGQYVIQDLPTFSILQWYFLNMTGHEAEYRLDVSGVPSRKISCTNALQFADNINNEKLYVGTWSLSEVGSETRKNQEEIMRYCKYFLLAYRDTFEGFDNAGYFSEYCQKRNDIEWRTEPIAHIPKSFYLFGKEKR